MNVMMIEPLDDGGIAHYAFNLMNALVEKETQVLLFTTRNYELAHENSKFKVYPNMFRLASYLTGKFPWLARETRVPSFLRRSIKLFEYPVDVLGALLIAREKDIDIVHFQTVNLTELLMILAFRLANAKVVFTIHNILPRHQKLKFYHGVMYRIVYSLCDRIIIHTENGKKDVEELFSVNPGKISVIPHGDYKFFIPEVNLASGQAKAVLGISSDTRTILFFGAIRPNKGLDNLLLAMPRVKKYFPNIKLLIIGEPCENYKRYRDIIEKEGIQDDIVEKLDYIPNDQVGLYFYAADVIVLPYNEITQSGVLQIAYAFGKPVVATGIGGFKEAIEHGKNGFLVPPGDIDALARRTVEIICNGEKMEKMGRHSRYLSDTKYSWDAIATQTMDVYSQCGV